MNSRISSIRQPTTDPSLKVIDGVGYTIQAMKRLEYTGEWADDGFDVYRNGQWLCHFWGYPVESDIRNFLNNSLDNS